MKAKNNSQEIMIPLNLYKKIHQNMPILCVEMVVLDKDNNFLLVKRRNEPLKEKWWIIGGRVNKNESLKKAAIRKAKEEIGIEVKIIKQLALEETIFKTGPFGWPTHTVNIVFLARTKNKNIKLNEQSGFYSWFSRIDKSWPSYVKKQIQRAYK